METFLDWRFFCTEQKVVQGFSEERASSSRCAVVFWALATHVYLWYLLAKSGQSVFNQFGSAETVGYQLDHCQAFGEAHRACLSNWIEYLFFNFFLSL